MRCAPQKIFSKLKFVLLVVVLCACSEVGHAGPKEELWIELSDQQRVIFNVEIADEPEERKQGLMNRTLMAKDSGMLFLFEEEVRRAFWMKNTFIPLDIIFLRHDGTIHHIHRMAKPQDETRITAVMPSAAVLEINGGMSDKIGIKEGDTVIHPFFNNTHL